MFLKSIEIRGFKSFADKTELNFRKGVTAVVGPNGSGKSNISDAIRWVLGEQSIKTLRGGKMEDVIFAGTQYRKPVGLAQVSLTLDNTTSELPIDYSDVTISRRLYRSGESEYFINNTSCRLKDIHELFMDTGIGKEGYSIIGQGKIDAILSGKPEERRSLLEEAAGIVKFKTRKEEAEKKLENTDQNLTRIYDILSTYEERLEPLRIENEKAKSFIELSSKLNSLELSLIVKSIKDIENKLKDQLSLYDNILQDINSIAVEREKYKEKLHFITETLESQETKGEKHKELFDKSRDKLHELESEISLLDERCTNLNKNIIQHKKDEESINVKLNTLLEEKIKNEKALIEKQDKQNHINKSITQHEESIKELNEQISEMSKKVSEERENAIEILRNIAEIKNQITIYHNELGSLNIKLEQLDVACKNYENSLKINSTTMTMLKAEEDKYNGFILDYEYKIKENKKIILNLQNNINKLEVIIKEKNTSLNKLEANHALLSNLENQYEGYNKSVKNLMQHLNSGKIPLDKDKVQVLGEVIKVPERFETAIEIALGSAISNIITEEESEAKSLINYLKQHNLGRATFLPLSIIKGRKIILKDQLKQLKGFIGIASDIINCNSKFNIALDYVLGRTLVCDTMEDALTLAKATDFSYKIVTLQGEVVNPGGALTGGSIYQKNISVIGRKREINDISNKILELKNELENLYMDIANKRKNLKELDDSCLNFRDEIHYNKLEIAKVQSKIGAMEEDNEKLKKGLKTSLQEMTMIKDKIINQESILANKQKQLLELSEVEESSKLLISTMEKSFKEKEEQFTDRKEELTELKVKKAQIDEFVSNEIKNLVRISKEVDDINARLENININLEIDKKSIEESKTKISSNKVEIDRINVSIESMKTQFEKDEILKSKYKNEINILNSKLEELSDVIQKKEEEKNKINITKTKYEVEKENFYLKLNEEMGLTYLEALDKALPVEDMDGFKKDINILKRNISELGTVNLGAIEEYEDIKNKYDFMMVQREDLISAKEELVGVITEMTQKMKSVFNKNFEILRQNFNNTFKELFKGGSADLILSQGDELTANIDINVQPPGKKLQNINLMSGGEKVLSAIALLFAILKMKPTPFCILDEIEAALDDANVYRYAEFLRQFSSKIQFIVITHRKGTMEASDVLYGVTMEEKGISKIVSVDLSA